jgi:hypothetical protein
MFAFRFLTKKNKNSRKNRKLIRKIKMFGGLCENYRESEISENLKRCFRFDPSSLAKSQRESSRRKGEIVFYKVGLDC